MRFGYRAFLSLAVCALVMMVTFQYMLRHRTQKRIDRLNLEQLRDKDINWKAMAKMEDINFQPRHVVRSIINIEDGTTSTQSHQDMSETFGNIDRENGAKLDDFVQAPMTKTLKGFDESRITSTPYMKKPKYSSFPDQQVHSSKMRHLTREVKVTKDASKVTISENIGCSLIEDRVKSDNIPFKIFIYDMPQKLVHNPFRNVTKASRHWCVDLTNCGIGRKMYEDGLLASHNSHQFSLEVIIHHKLLVSPYRTFNPEEADIFYAPVHGFPIISGKNREPVKKTVDDFFKFLNTSVYFQKGKPHLSTVPKIQRESGGRTWPMLSTRDSHRLLYLTIEKELGSQSRIRQNLNVKVIPVPYPSYVHYHPRGLVKKEGEYQLSEIAFLKKKRNIFLFWAAGTRKSNWQRANIIMPQFNYTSLSYEEYISNIYKQRQNLNLSLDDAMVPKVWLQTPECSEFHRNLTVQWMQHSVFCLQPSGDSPTRKSIYDSILSGCIPVLFEHPKGNVSYPFATKLNYKEFTANLSLSEQNTLKYFEILKNKYNESEILRLQKRLVENAPKFQYSYPLNNGAHKDALRPILDEVGEFFKLPK